MRHAGFLALLFALLLQAARAAEPVTLVALGTSLTSGYGLMPEDTFTAQLTKALNAKGYDVKFIDAGVSGDTTAGGLARLDWVLTPETRGVIIELGSNDALRGLSPEETERNLDRILAELARRKIPALLTGMKAPRNLGRDYAAAFDTIYPRLAKKYGVVFYPFFLDGVAANLALNQEDGIHPNAAGVKLIVQRMLPSVEQLLARVRAIGNTESDIR
jgi:acyl-CoA thioesterase-1